MNTPLSFIPDGQAMPANKPASFVPDNMPSSFQPDSPVLNKNATGISWTPQAAMAPAPVAKPADYVQAVKDVANAPLTLLGHVAAAMMNQMADKSRPDIQQAKEFPDAASYRSGLQQRLFGPSNLR